MQGRQRLQDMLDRLAETAVQLEAAASDAPALKGTIQVQTTSLHTQGLQRSACQDLSIMLYLRDWFRGRAAARHL